LRTKLFPQISSADGITDRLPELAAELVLLPVDVIVAAFTPCVLAAKHATTTIPIVMAAVADPIGAGLVQSLARPGGNITGFSNMAAETAGKASNCYGKRCLRFAEWRFWSTRTIPFTRPLLEQVHLAGRTAGIAISPVAMVRGPDEVEAAFIKMKEEGAEAVVVQGIFFSRLLPNSRSNIICRQPRTTAIRASRRSDVVRCRCSRDFSPQRRPRTQDSTRRETSGLAC
jgi:putative ABC transport system substrate-binding protein